jgi:hypothetical protein
MTETIPFANGHDAVLRPWIELWSRSMDQGADSARAFLEGGRAGFDPAALRRQWLDTLGRSLDAYMRTPAFLESMRRGFQAMTEVKGNTEDLAQEVARETGIPRMPDISGLFERLQIGQEAIHARLTAIEHRLEHLERPADGRRKRDG